MTYLTNWDERFIRLVEHEIKLWSKDPKKQVGALLVSPDYRQWSGGYNGLPRGIESSDISMNRKNDYFVHAEANAILNSAVDLTGWTLYVTTPPCLSCATLVIQKRIAKVVQPHIDSSSSWYGSQLEAQRLFQLTKTEVITYGTENY